MKSQSEWSKQCQALGKNAIRNVELLHQFHPQNWRKWTVRKERQDEWQKYQSDTNMKVS